MGKKICILKAFRLSKCIKLFFSPENMKKILGFTSKFRYSWVTLNTDIFYLALKESPQQTNSQKAELILAYLAYLAIIATGIKPFIFYELANLRQMTT